MTESARQTSDPAPEDVRAQAREQGGGEPALWNSAAWIREVVKTAVEGIVAIGEDGTIEYMNPAAHRMFGYGTGEALGQNVCLLMPPEHADSHHTYIAHYLESGGKRGMLRGKEVIGKRKDGSTFPLHRSVSEVRIDGHRHFTGILRDISQEKEVEKEKDQLLQELQERNKKITCLYSVGEAIRANDTVRGMLRDVVRLIQPSCFQPDQTHASIAFDEDVFLDDRFEETPWRYRVDIVVAGRRRGFVEVFYLVEQDDADAERFLDEEHNLIEAIAYTLGESIDRREAEAMVIQASKLASVGELAAGVSHEINNPTNGIINCADILIENLQPGSENHEFAQLIRSEAERIAVIVRNLLIFSQQDKDQRGPSRLCDIVSVVLSLSQTSIARSRIDLRVNVSEDLPKIRCSSEQIQQVLMNLILNAVYALDERYPDGGLDKILAINAKCIESEGQDLMRLTVEDHGPGIAQANRVRIFDPFFTTKGRDKGTGLGLSVSSGIVKEHGGYITVESELGKWTRFHVILPVDGAPTEKVKEY